MSDIKIKMIGSQINKYERKYKQTHSHLPQLYKLCTDIVNRYRELEQIAYYNSKDLCNKHPNTQQTSNTSLDNSDDPDSIYLE